MKIRSLCCLFVPFLNICRHLLQKAQTCYLVGGAVRDFVLGKEIKDIDIEVHGISLEMLEQVLENYGVVRHIGKKFGVLRLNGNNIDWSLPRRDSKGRKPTVTIDEGMTIEQACRRRDITMNAMAIDLQEIIAACDKEQNKINIIDPYGGLEDIAQKRICAVDEELFIEDPLRLFRVMHFMARFEMNPDESLNRLCQTMSLYDDARSMPIAQERIQDEFKKMFLRSQKPSRGLLWLYEIGRISEILPEIAVIFEQKDIKEKLMRSLDAIVLDSAYQQNNQEKHAACLAALIYYVDEEHKKQVLSYFTSEVLLRKKACLFNKHINIFDRLGNVVDYKKSAAFLRSSTNLKWLAHFACHMGMITESEYQQHERLACLAGVWEKAEDPVLKGKDFLDIMEPSKALGDIVKKAYKIQLEQGIKDPAQLKAYVIKNQ